MKFHSVYSMALFLLLEMTFGLHLQINTQNVLCYMHFYVDVIILDLHLSLFYLLWSE